MEDLNRRLAALESSPQSGDVAEVVDAGADDVHGHDQADCGDQDWKPPRHWPGMSDAGVVTLEEQIGAE